MSYHELELGKDEKGQPWRDRPLAYLRENEPDYSDACFLSNRWPKVFDVPEYFASGDYHGGFAEQSNYEAWQEEFAATEGKTWWDLGQGHGILVRLDIQTTDEKTAVKRVLRGGVLDPDHLEHLEQETMMEQWNDYGRPDFKREIRQASIEEDADAIDTLLDVIPNKVFDGAWWDADPRGNYSPTAEGLSWIFHTDDIFTDRWDGSLGGFLEFLRIETTAKVIVRLTDTAFTSWKPGARPGEKTRFVAITPAQLEQSAPDALSRGDVATLLRNAELRVPFDYFTGALCNSLYLECEYPWGEVEEEPQENPAFCKPQLQAEPRRR